MHQRCGKNPRWPSSHYLTGAITTQNGAIRMPASVITAKSRRHHNAKRRHHGAAGVWQGCGNMIAECVRDACVMLA